MRTLVGRRSRTPQRILQCVLVVLWSICAAAFVRRAGVGVVNGKLAGGRELLVGDGRLEERYGLRGGAVKQEEGWTREDGRQLAARKVEEIARSVAVLMDLKRCVNASSPGLADWNDLCSGNPYCYCNWTGVVCDDARVVKLQLFTLGLRGTITCMLLANLTWLKEVDLSNNLLTGSVPSDLPRELELLDLSNNTLTGSVPSDLPRGLKQLYLQNNKLDGEIPESLSQLSDLQQVDLASNQLRGRIPGMLANLSLLSYLDLSSNLLDGEIPASLSKLSRLQSLYLTSNQLRGGIPGLLLSNCTSLSLLWLSQNQFSGQLPSSLGQLRSLKSLALYNNRFSGPIPSALANCSSLTSLDLAYNSFSHFIPSQLGSIFFQAPQDLSSSAESVQLKLQYNNLSGSIPHSLGNCSGLTYLDLCHNNLTNTIPAEIGQLPNLMWLYLNENALTGNIPTAFGNLSQLEKLYIAQNELSGSIPESLTLLPNLRELESSHNCLHGSIPPRISSIRLRHLSFNTNSLSGMLPSSVANCTQLLKLDFSNNSLTGLIAPSLGNLTNLGLLDLHHNRFSGSIPRELAGCLRLSELNLGINNLSGRIPSSLGNLRQSLNKLYLQQNELQGPIPSSLGNATNLLDVNLSHNNLNEIIPASIANLRNLAISLDLSHNHLAGQLSQAVGAFIFVQTIDLSVNQFYGEIPKMFGDCSNLQTLNLSVNALNWTIPPALGGLKFLVKLDLSVNKLSGKIPSNFLSESQLKIFNVSQNQLDGEIPRAFRNFPPSSFSKNSGLCGRPLPFDCSHSNRLTGSHSGRSTGSVAAAIVCGIFGAALFLSCVVTWRYKSRLFSSTKKKSSNQDLPKGVSILRVTPEELHVATNGYCESNLLGVGGSSKVYRGILRDGKAVAIKRFNLEENHEEAERIFHKECEILRKIRHRNLVPILSTCCNLEMKAIVLDYMPNGSLEKHLFGGDVFDLDWNKIFNIALNVGNALVYLHYDYGVPIIHCDLKPSNILLDKDFIAHVADFGIAKLLSPKMTTSTSHFRGSIGYIAPEFAEFSHHSTKGDVYSYGVVLLCMLTRKQPTSDIFDHGVDLSTWVKMFLPDMFLDVIDSTLRDQVKASKCEAEVSLVLKVALLCTSRNPSTRPTSKEVLEMLYQIRGYRSNSNSMSSNS